MHFVIGRQTIFCVFMCSRFGVHLRTPKKQNTISPNDRIGLNYIIQSIGFKILVSDRILLLKILVLGYESSKKILVVGCVLAK